MRYQKRSDTKTSKSPDSRVLKLLALCLIFSTSKTAEFIIPKHRSSIPYRESSISLQKL